MGLSDSKKENKVKLKSYRSRSGNIKDFHGRRKTVESRKIFSAESEIIKDIVHKQNPFSVSPFGSLGRPFFPPQNPNRFSLFESKMLHSPRDEPCTLWNKDEALNKSDPRPMQSFQQHMVKWQEDFHKPFSAISQNSEFDMPYCYSKEFFNQEYAKPVVKFDFGSSSQLAVPQDYRHRPFQMILIKSSMAQLVAEACDLNNAEMYFDRFVDDRIQFEMSHSAFFQAKNEAAIYLVPETESGQECKDVQLRSDCTIYTSSWHN